MSGRVACRKTAAWRTNTIRTLVFKLALLVFSVALLGVASSIPGSDEFRLRRVLVPADRIEEVVRGQGSHLTVDRQQFDRLLQAENETPESLRRESPFSHAVLYGGLGSNGVLQGHGSLHVAVKRSEQSWLEIPAPSFWVGYQRWVLSTTERGTTRQLPLRTTLLPGIGPTGLGGVFGLGAFALPDRTNEFNGVIADQTVVASIADGIEVPAITGTTASGSWAIESIGATRLDFDWLASPEFSGSAGSNGSGLISSDALLPAISSRSGINALPSFGPPSASPRTSRQFKLQLAGAVQTTFWLELPLGQQPVVTQGIVRKVNSVPTQREQNRQLWRIDVGPEFDGWLTLTTGEIAPLANVSEASGLVIEGVCELLPGMVELRTTVRWTAGSRDELTWTVPPGWRTLPITGPRGNVLSADPVISPAANLAPGVTVASDADSNRGTEQLRVSGLRDAEVDQIVITLQRSYDYGERLQIRLPRLQGEWQRGTFSLLRSGRFDLVDLKLSGGRWIAGAMPTEGTAPLNAIAFGPDMELGIQIRPIEGGLEGTALTMVEAEAGQVSAELQAWLRPIGEPTFVWRAALSEGWLVDRVSANEIGVPDVGLVESWDVIAGDDGRTWIEVRFQSSLKDGRELALTVAAHRLSFPSPLEPLQAAELRLVDWEPRTIVRHWLALQSENPYRFASIGDRVPQRVRPASDDRIGVWAAANPTARLISLEVDNELEFSLRTELDNQIDVDVEIGATLFDRSAREQVVLRCRPVGGRPNELTLAWDRPAGSEWEWTLVAPSLQRSFPVQELDARADERDEPLRSTLSWGVGLGDPFVLIGTSVESWDQQWHPRVPRLPGARQSTGLLTVVSLAREPLLCESDSSARLPASVARLSGNERLLTIVDLAAAAFPVTVQRKNESSSIAGDRTEEAQSSLLNLPSNQSIQSLLSSAMLESWPGANGSRHLLTLTLGADPPAQIVLQIPPGARRINQSLRNGTALEPEPSLTSMMRVEKSDQGSDAPSLGPLNSNPSVSNEVNTNEPADRSDVTETAAPNDSSTDTLTPSALEFSGIDSVAEPAGKGIWIVNTKGRLAGDQIEIAFVTNDRIPAMLGTLHCRWPVSDLSALNSSWHVHLPGGCEVATRVEAGDERDAIATWLIERWLGFAVAWRPAIGPFRVERGIGIERNTSRIDPTTVVIGSGPESHLQVRRPEVLRWWCAAAVLVQSALWLAIFKRRAIAAPFVAAILAVWVPETWVDLTWTMVPGAMFAAVVSVRAALRSKEISPTTLDRKQPAQGRKAAVLATSGMLLALPLLPNFMEAAVGQERLGTTIAATSGSVQDNGSRPSTSPTPMTTPAGTPSPTIPAGTPAPIVSGEGPNHTSVPGTNTPGTQAASPRAPQVTHTIYIPVDEKGNESKDLIVVPQGLYDQLLRATPRSGDRLPWIVESVQHLIEAEPNPFDDFTRLRLTSRFRIRSFEPSTNWPIPRLSESLTLQADQMEVDSATARITGAPDGSLRVALGDPGVHEVVVSAIDLIGAGRAERATWTLPTAVGAEVRANQLVSQGIEVVQPLSWLDLGRPGLDRFVRLGPTVQVDLQTRRRTSTPTSAPTSLGMLQVLEPVNGRGEMTVWLSAGARTALPDRIVLGIRGDWELASTSPTEILGTRSEQNGETLVELLPSAMTSRPNWISVVLRSPLPLTPGRWQLPVLRIDNHPVAARHMVWRQPAQAAWGLETAGGVSLTGVDSLATWWSPDQLAAMRVSEGQRQVAARNGSIGEWLRVSPLETIAAVDHQVEIALSPSKASWSLSSVVSVMKGEVASIQLEATLPIEVETLEMVGGDGPVPVEMVRLSARRLLILLPAPQRTTFHLVGKGRWRAAPGVTQPLPLLKFPDINDVRYRFSYTRSPEVRIGVEGAIETTPQPSTPAEESTSAPVDFSEGLSAFASQWTDSRSAQLDGDSAAVNRWSAWRLNWRSSRYAKLDRTTIQFRRDASGWGVTVEVRVAADDPWGADRFDVLVPDGFVRVETEGVGNWEAGELAVGTNSGTLRWTATRRILPGERVLLKGQLARFPDGRIMPRVLSGIEPERIVELPPADPADPFVWRYDRYRPIDEAVPTDETSENPSGEVSVGSGGLRLLEEETSATLRLASKPLVARPSRIFLAEHRIATNWEGLSVESRFVLDPGGRSRVRLATPENARVIRVTIDGELRSVDENGSIELTSRELPQDLRVILLLANASIDELWAESNRQTKASDSQKPTEQQAAWIWWPMIPTLDVKTLKTVVAIRPSQSLPRWNVGGESRELSVADWSRAIDGATDGARGSLATVAGMSPAAMTRWSEAWSARVLVPDPSQPTAETPELLINGTDGLPIWRVPDVGAISNELQGTRYGELPAGVISGSSSDLGTATSVPRSETNLPSSASSQGNSTPTLSMSSNDVGNSNPIREPIGSVATEVRNPSLVLGPEASRGLPADALSWSVWEWEEEGPKLAPQSASSRPVRSMVVSLIVLGWSVVVATIIRLRPYSAINLVDLSCTGLGILWVLSIQPLGPGIVLLIAGLLPPFVRRWRLGSGDRELSLLRRG